MIRNSNYSNDSHSEENFNSDDKYSETGESEFSRDTTIPFDENEVLSERHYSLGSMEDVGRRIIRRHDIPRSTRSDANHAGRGPKGYQRSDEKIKEDVSEALYRSSEVDASYIEVFVSKGHVSLKGSVESRAQKKLAERTIENVSGVIDVFNELHVKQEEPAIKPGKYGLMNNITGMN